MYKDRFPRPNVWLSGAALIALLGASGCAVDEMVGSADDAPAGAAISAAVSGTGTVLVGAGNIARCDRQNDEATAALLDGIEGTVFTTGDNAYPSGSASEFADCYGASWGRHKERTRPSVGDLDYKTSGAAAYFAYFGTSAGEPGAGYYSYDVGDWHVVVLNSSITMGAGSVQEQWLRADLAANPKWCTLAYWHYPRFSSFSTSVRSEIKPLWDALYDAGVDLVLNGHYRLYERFAPQDPDGQADPEYGIRQITIGTGGISTNSFGQTQPNSEVRRTGIYGVLKVTLSFDGYEWEYVPVAGSFTDSGSQECHRAPGEVSVGSVEVSPAVATVVAGQTTQLEAVAKDEDGNALSGQAMSWTSSDTLTATISAAGIVTGIAVGTAYITASAGGEIDTATVTVTGERVGYYVAPDGSSGNGGTSGAPWTLAYALAGAGGRLAPGDTVWLREGTYAGTFRTALAGAPGSPIVFRQYPGERATLDGGLRVDGPDVVFWGFEIMQSAPLSNGTLPALEAHGARTKFINLVIHDAAQQGITFWDGAVDAEVYGSIVYNNGTRENLDHGIYVHNTSGTKLVEDNVFFNNLAYGIHVYATSNNGTQRNVHVIGNASFGNGSISTQWSERVNMLVGAEVPGEGMRVEENMLYYGGTEGRNMWIGYTAPSEDVVVRGNTVWGGWRALLVGEWADATVQDNTIGGTDEVVALTEASLAGHVWSGNRYYRDPAAAAWGLGDEMLSLAGWQAATELGAGDVALASSPGTPTVFVRLNRYEAGRAHVVVYNWTQQGSVPIDLSAVLLAGQRYEIRNVQDPFGPPVASGTYDGGTVSLSMAGVAPPLPLGRSTPVPPRTGPNFDVFIVTPPAN